MNLRRNNYREFLGRKPPLIVQDVIDVLFAIAIVSAAMLTVMLWFLVSTVSGPLGPSPRTLDAIAFRIVSPLLISWTELGPSMVFFVQLAWWAAVWARALGSERAGPWVAASGRVCPVPLTVRGTQALVSFAPLAFKLFCAARQNAVLRRSPFPPP